ncbi:MAG: hypothetical protein MI810_12900 [Flavobacteriales bacterium]|nr:hypothetical protein [Flavobacteriales bacterium]
MQRAFKIIMLLSLMGLMSACFNATETGGSEVVVKEEVEDTMVLADGITYYIHPIDELFTTFCCGSDESKDYYLSYSFIIKSRLDTLILNDEYFDGRTNLITHELDGSVYDSGFFLFDGDSITDWYSSKSKGDTVLIKCYLKRPQYSGMLGTDLVFDDCLIVE